MSGLAEFGRLAFGYRPHGLTKGCTDPHPYLFKAIPANAAEKCRTINFI